VRSLRHGIVSRNRQLPRSSYPICTTTSMIRYRRYSGGYRVCACAYREMQNSAAAATRRVESITLLWTAANFSLSLSLSLRFFRFYRYYNHITIVVIRYSSLFRDNRFRAIYTVRTLIDNNIRGVLKKKMFIAGKLPM